MFKAMPRAATRESRPTIKPRPPKNSAAIARIANNAGICMVFVKKPMVPLKPSPPNQPNIFCAPCAKNTTPSANRRIAVAASFSVEMSFRNIVPPVLSLLLYAPFHEDCCRSPRSAGGNREHREAAPKAEAPGIHASCRGAMGIAGDVARETGAILSLSRCGRGILIPARRRAFWPGGGPSCARLGELEWAGMCAPIGRAEAKRWSPRTRTGRNSHCGSTALDSTLRGGLHGDTAEAGKNPDRSDGGGARLLAVLGWSRHGREVLGGTPTGFGEQGRGRRTPEGHKLVRHRGDVWSRRLRACARRRAAGCGQGERRHRSGDKVDADLPYRRFDQGHHRRTAALPGALRNRSAPGAPAGRLLLRGVGDGCDGGPRGGAEDRRRRGEQLQPRSDAPRPRCIGGAQDPARVKPGAVQLAQPACRVGWHGRGSEGAGGDDHRVFAARTGSADRQVPRESGFRENPAWPAQMAI